MTTSTTKKATGRVSRLLRLVRSNLRFNRFDVISILTNDHQAAAEIAFDLDVLTTGGHIADEQIHLWNFNQQGKVVHFRHYVDTAKHIAAANKNQ